MADYTTIALMRGLLPKGVKIDDSTTDPPSAATVTGQIIPGITGETNVALARAGVGIPIDPSQTALLAFLQQLNTREGVYQVLVQRGVAEDPKFKPLWQSWHDEYRKLIEETEELLASFLSLDLPWSYTMDADTEDPTDSRNPIFIKDYVP